MSVISSIRRHDHPGAEVVTMAQFETVLDQVRLALTLTSPAEVHAYIEGLVKEGVISEAYSKTLSLHRLFERKAAGLLRYHHNSSRRSTSNWILDQDQLLQERTGGTCVESDLNQTRLESSVDEPDLFKFNLPDEFHLSHRLFPTPIDQDYTCHLDMTWTELPESTQTPQDSASERVTEGNLEEEREWLEQVEQAARRLAVPLWQHWNGGQRMLMPLVPTAGCETNKETNREAHCGFLNTEEETEVACRALESYGNFLSTDAELLHFYSYESCGTVEYNINHVDVPRNLGHASSIEASTDTGSTRREDVLSVCAAAEMTTNTEEDWFCLPRDEECSLSQFFHHIPEDTCTNLLDGSFYSDESLSMPLGAEDVSADVPRTHSSEICNTSGKMDFSDKKVQEDGVDSLYSAMMQEIELDASLLPDLGELPDDLSEYFSEECFKTIDTDVLFGDPWINCWDEVSNSGDAGMPAATPRPEKKQQQELENEETAKTERRRKRARAAPRLESCDENTPPRPKRQRAADNDTKSEPNTADTASLATTPPKIVHLHQLNSIQFITLPEATGYHVVQTLGLSPFPNTATSPTYILVPATSPPCKRQLPPLSPVDGTVAPVRMSSSPPGSLSDTASRAMSPRVASPLSPNNEFSTSKEVAQPQSPTIINIPENVKGYIQEAKAHMRQSCQDIEEGLSLTPHYVDMQVSKRDILRSGKSTSKSLDKEMVIMGNTDRKRTLVGRSQIFEGLNREKPKRYILLLGNTGMGKTTLVRKLCLDWSEDCFPQFDFVFLLDGRALTLNEPSYSLQTLLLNHSSFASPCMDPEAVYTQILAASKRVLIIFDGFDEVRDYETLLQTQEKDLVASLQKDSKAQVYTVKQLYSAILQRVLLPGCTLLLSARPRGTANQLLRRTESLLEMCGFTPTDIETYLSQYFTDPSQRESALGYLKDCSYLNLLSWNPGLCRLVCLVLEQAKSLEVLPRTLTGLCHQVLHLKLEKDSRSNQSQANAETQIPMPCVEEKYSSQPENTQTKSRSRARTRFSNPRASRTKQQGTKEEVDEQKMHATGRGADRTEERDLLTQLSSLAWEGVKANSSILPNGPTISPKLKAFGHRTGLVQSYHPRKREVVLSEERQDTGEDKDKSGKRTLNQRWTDTENSDALDGPILSWANPFLQSHLAGVHLSLSRTITDRIFLQNLPFQSGPRGRRRPQREELELTQRFAVGLLFHKQIELRTLHSYTEAAFREMVDNKQALLRKHLRSLSYGDLSPAQVLEACHHVYEAGFAHRDASIGRISTSLVSHLAVSLPELVTFHGVPLNPSDVFTIQNVLEKGGSVGRSFCLDLENSGIQISGLRALVGLDSINKYRACIADVITLWEQLAQSGEEELLQKSISKFKIHPFKATQVCHIEHLTRLVNIHLHQRLLGSSSQTDSIFSEGVPAVKELHKLEFELGPENGPLALPKLWELLPGLQNLRHLDLENCKIGDKGAEKLADALAYLHCLEILNLSQNCIGDHGVRKLATPLKDLPNLHCLSLYSNVISDEGAESLAAILPHMTSLTQLDVKYNKVTDVGAQSLGGSLRTCKRMKTLRMWNQYIPYGVFERLKQQDSRID